MTFCESGSGPQCNSLKALLQNSVTGELITSSFDIKTDKGQCKYIYCGYVAVHYKQSYNNENFQISSRYIKDNQFARF